MKKVMLISIILVFSSIAAHARDPVQKMDKISVVASILPLAYFVENIGGDTVDVSVMVRQGANPHTYEPTPGQLKKVNTAEMYVKVGSGIDFELAWMDKLIALNKNMLVCDSSQDVSLLHGADPHIWLSPLNAIHITENIKNSLIRINPQNREDYNRNAKELSQRLLELDRKIRKKLAHLKNRAFIVFHPAWGYFASEYNLQQIPVEIEGKEPTAKALADVILMAREKNIHLVFASPQFSSRSAEVIAREIDGKVVHIDPLAGDYAEMLTQITEILASHLQ